MNVRVDEDLCSGCELCANSVPDIFKMEDNLAKVIQADVPANLEEDVRDVADSCPVEAIIVD
ncbi:MAG: ferredoxin [Spirochaetaceae bacterium]|nr:MAG: ferredoxin [Spirochaetaceae bacterium]